MDVCKRHTAVCFGGFARCAVPVPEGQYMRPFQIAQLALEQVRQDAIRDVHGDVSGLDAVMRRDHVDSDDSRDDDAG
jgi:hypothetical protein